MYLVYKHSIINHGATARIMFTSAVRNAKLPTCSYQAMVVLTEMTKEVFPPPPLRMTMYVHYVVLNINNG